MNPTQARHIIVSTDEKVKQLIKKLQSENDTRSCKLQANDCSVATRAQLVYSYNNTLEIIKQLETIVNK